MNKITNKLIEIKSQLNDLIYEIYREVDTDTKPSLLIPTNKAYTELQNAVAASHNLPVTEREENQFACYDADSGKLLGYVSGQGEGAARMRAEKNWGYHKIGTVRKVITTS